MTDVARLCRLASAWEQQAARQPEGDRYKAGLSICAEQLRGELASLERDAGTESDPARPEAGPFEFVLSAGYTFCVSWSGEMRDAVVGDFEYDPSSLAPCGVWVRSLSADEMAAIQAEAGEPE